MIQKKLLSFEEVLLANFGSKHQKVPKRLTQALPELTQELAIYFKNTNDLKVFLENLPIEIKTDSEKYLFLIEYLEILPWQLVSNEKKTGLLNHLVLKTYYDDRLYTLLPDIIKELKQLGFNNSDLIKDQTGILDLTIKKFINCVPHLLKIIKSLNITPSDWNLLITPLSDGFLSNIKTTLKNKGRENYWDYVLENIADLIEKLKIKKNELILLSNEKQNGFIDLLVKSTDNLSHFKFIPNVIEIFKINRDNFNLYVKSEKTGLLDLIHQLHGNFLYHGYNVIPKIIRHYQLSPQQWPLLINGTDGTFDSLQVEKGGRNLYSLGKEIEKAFTSLNNEFSFNDLFNSGTGLFDLIIKSDDAEFILEILPELIKSLKIDRNNWKLIFNAEGTGLLNNIENNSRTKYVCRVLLELIDRLEITAENMDKISNANQNGVVDVLYQVHPIYSEEKYFELPTALKKIRQKLIKKPKFYEKLIRHKAFYIKNYEKNLNLVEKFVLNSALDYTFAHNMLGDFIVLESENPNQSLKNLILHLIKKGESSKDFKTIVLIISMFNSFYAITSSWPEIEKNTIPKTYEIMKTTLAIALINKFNIPEALIKDNRLNISEELIIETLANYSQLIGNNDEKIDQTALKLMVLGDLTNLTFEIKMGMFPQEILNYFSEEERSTLQGYDFTKFPLIDRPTELQDWINEKEEIIRINYFQDNPFDQLSDLKEKYQMALHPDHFSKDWISDWQTYQAIPEKKTYMISLNQQGQLAFEQKDTSPEDYKKVVKAQDQASIFSIQQKITDAFEALQNELKQLHYTVLQIQRQKKLLTLIHYQMPQSPQTYLWPNELRLLGEKIINYQSEIIQSNLEKERDRIIDLSEQLKSQAKLFGEHLKNQINLVSKLAEKLKKHEQIEAVRQLENTIKRFSGKNESGSYLAIISDLTMPYKILKALQEDGNCLSPLNGVNSHTNAAFLDPNKKLLTIRNKENNTLLINMIMTLGFLNGETALFMDNIYSRSNPTHFLPNMIQYLKKRFPGFKIVDSTGEYKLEGSTLISNAEIKIPGPQVGGIAYLEGVVVGFYEEEIIQEKDVVVF